VEQALGLRSNWFSIGSLSLKATSSHVLYGNPVRVVARAANVDGATLMQRAAGGPWRTVGRVQNGGSALSLDLHASTTFRVALAGTNGTSVSVAVAPRVRVQALSAKVLSGKVLPRPSAPVQVWRRVRGDWRVVAHPILNADGEFRTPLPLRAVDYKITVAAAGRLAAAQTYLHVTRQLLASLGP
jgi:hypothetical protein